VGVQIFVDARLVAAEGGQPGAGVRPRSHLDRRYSDWGTADPVDPPPAADVADVADYPDTSEIDSKLRAEM
jgi:hypothetical protein